MDSPQGVAEAAGSNRTRGRSKTGRGTEATGGPIRSPRKRIQRRGMARS
jgi:hypothetical protein